MTVALLVLMIGFLIWKGLVIFSTTGNKVAADGERTMRLADVKGPAGKEKLIVICYKQQYWYKQRIIS